MSETATTASKAQRSRVRQAMEDARTPSDAQEALDALNDLVEEHGPEGHWQMMMEAERLEMMARSGGLGTPQGGSDGTA